MEPNSPHLLNQSVRESASVTCPVASNNIALISFVSFAEDWRAS